MALIISERFCFEKTSVIWTGPGGEVLSGKFSSHFNMKPADRPSNTASLVKNAHASERK
jgi:hypothetical protein